MREILFRGQYDKDMWIEGNPIVTNDGTFIYFGNGHAYWNNAEQCMQVENLLKVEPETVGQFTGLLDRNESKIFEGDIIVFGESKPHKICMSNGAWLARNIIPNNYHYYGVTLGCIQQGEIKIIGNIHDNPELLEVK